MTLPNCYEDARRAAAYAQLQFPGTYYLAYRDLPAILREHVRGTRALDFGCGAGRSTRFLREQGFDAVGVDIAAEMVTRARALDPGGDYLLVDDGDLAQFDSESWDLVLSAFTFDNVATLEKKVHLLRELGRLLKPQGAIVNLVSSPEIYRNEWASFTTRDFPENARARTGDRVRIVMTDVDDRRPVEDILWSHEAYEDVYARAGLACVHTHRPLGNANEPCRWVSETRIAPWVIYVLRRAEARPAPRPPRSSAGR